MFLIAILVLILIDQRAKTNSPNKFTIILHTYSTILVDTFCGMVTFARRASFLNLNFLFRVGILDAAIKVDVHHTTIENANNAISKVFIVLVIYRSRSPYYRLIIIIDSKCTSHQTSETLIILVTGATSSRNLAALGPCRHSADCASGCRSNLIQ